MKRNPALYLCLALSGSVHLGLILLLAWGGVKAYQVLQQVEVSYVAGATKSRSHSGPTVIKTPAIVKAAAENSPAPSETTTTQSEVTPLVTADVNGGGLSAEMLKAYEIYALEVASTLNRRKVYPEVSRRLRQQGRVKVRFRVERSGRVMEAEVIESSDFPQLNMAARRLIEEIRSFRPFPEDVKETTWLFTVPIEYTM
ncbi:MAG: energy transducer TonB [Bdellovibrionales bacterium]|nr:energy transducer TonB [Bdellovibrionales bacterium]